jgi:hypothetical protein
MKFNCYSLFNDAIKSVCNGVYNECALLYNCLNYYTEEEMLEISQEKIDKENEIHMYNENFDNISGIDFVYVSRINFDSIDFSNIDNENVINIFDVFFNYDFPRLTTIIFNQCKNIGVMVNCLSKKNLYSLHQINFIECDDFPEYELSNLIKSLCFLPSATRNIALNFTNCYFVVRLKKQYNLEEKKRITHEFSNMDKMIIPNLFNLETNKYYTDIPLNVLLYFDDRSV